MATGLHIGLIGGIGPAAAVVHDPRLSQAMAVTGPGPDTSREVLFAALADLTSERASLSAQE